MAVIPRGFNRLYDTPVGPTVADLLRRAQLDEQIQAAEFAAKPLGIGLPEDQVAMANQARAQATGVAKQKTAQAALDALRRLQQIQTAQQQFPGRMLGGSGPTGLNRLDEAGYRGMLEEQLEDLDIQAALAKKPKVTVSPYYTKESFPEPFKPLLHPSLSANLGSGTIGLESINQLGEQASEGDKQAQQALEGLRMLNQSWAPFGGGGAMLSPKGSNLPSRTLLPYRSIMRFR